MLIFFTLKLTVCQWFRARRETGSRWAMGFYIYLYIFLFKEDFSSSFPENVLPDMHCTLILYVSIPLPLQLGGSTHALSVTTASLMWVASLIPHINLKKESMHSCVFSRIRESLFAGWRRRLNWWRQGKKRVVLARFFSQLHGWGELIVVFFPFIIMNDIS